MQCVWYIRYTIVDIDTPNGSFNSKRVLLVSPSLHVEPASLAHGSRHTRQEAARPHAVAAPPRPRTIVGIYMRGSGISPMR